MSASFGGQPGYRVVARNAPCAPNATVNQFYDRFRRFLASQKNDRKWPRRNFPWVRSSGSVMTGV